MASKRRQFSREFKLEAVQLLRREVEQLKQERDFLKKAAAYFAKDQR